MIDIFSIQDVIRKSSSGDIDKCMRLIRENISQSEDETRRFKELFTALCYDRDACEKLGLDYNNLPREDINKLRLYTTLIVLSK